MTMVQERGPARAGRDRTGDARWPTAHELRAFVSLAETLHFGQTAAALGLAQSSLSEAIRRLESKLDVVLLERTSRRVALTEAGTRLLPVARTVLRGLEAARTAVGGPPPSGTRTLRIGIEGAGLAELNGPVLEAIAEARPGARLVVRESLGLPQAFFDQRLDLALVRTPAPEPLVVHPVALEARVLLLPPSHPAAGAAALRIRDVLDEPFVAVAPRAPRTRDYWLAADRRDGREARIGGVAHSAQEIVQAVGHLGLLSTGWRSLVRAHPLPAVATVPAEDLPPSVAGVALRGDERRPWVLEMVDLVRAVVAERADVAPGITPVP